MSLVRERMLALLATFFAALALILACIGLYGVMAYRVARRTREIGIRIAVGARQQSVVWMMVRETLLLVTIGAALGTLASLAANRYIAGQLFGVTPRDPIAIGVALSVLGDRHDGGWLRARAPGEPHRSGQGAAGGVKGCTAVRGSPRCRPNRRDRDTILHHRADRERNEDRAGERHGSVGVVAPQLALQQPVGGEDHGDADDQAHRHHLHPQPQHHPHHVAQFAAEREPDRDFARDRVPCSRAARRARRADGRAPARVDALDSCPVLV